MISDDSANRQQQARSPELSVRQGISRTTEFLSALSAGVALGSSVLGFVQRHRAWLPVTLFVAAFGLVLAALVSAVFLGFNVSRDAPDRLDATRRRVSRLGIGLLVVALVMLSIAGILVFKVDRDSHSTPGQASVPNLSSDDGPVPGRCDPTDLDVDKFRGTTAPVPVSLRVNAFGRDNWVGDPRVVWVFVNDQDSVFYPYNRPADRAGGGWAAPGIPIGRPSHPEDMKVKVRYLTVALLPGSAAAALQRMIEDDGFWTQRNATGQPGTIAALPEGTEVYARVPMELRCVG